jgi:hypothetical protein
MATTRTYPLHDNLMGGVDTTLPAHLLNPTQWRRQHNMRLVPTLQQIPRKVGAEAITTRQTLLWLGIIPSLTPGYGDAVAMTSVALYRRTASGWLYVNALTDDATPTHSTYRRWSTALYNGQLYFTNELNPLRYYANGLVRTVANAPAGRYMCFWYDHVVIGYPAGKPHTLQWSHLYDFEQWDPAQTNEADSYEMVEYQLTDFPYAGITGLGKLKGTLFVYTPTAIVPVRYVGLKPIIQVVDDGVISRCGNTFPWTLVCLDTVHFFYDAIEKMFFAFNGQTVSPIGEPVRQFMTDNLTDNLTDAQMMYGYVDQAYKEVWWPFVSKNSSGVFDKAVVFNYRYEKWYTASIENIHCFCSGSRTTTAIKQLAGSYASLTETLGSLGLDHDGLSRVYGTSTGRLFKETTSAEIYEEPYDDPILETPDFAYGDVRTIKEVDMMVLNTTAPRVDVQVATRNFLGETPVYDNIDGTWFPTLPDAMLTFKARAGRVFRYLFTLRTSANASFDAFSESVRVAHAEK